MKAFWGGGIAPRILDLGTKKEVNGRFTSRPLYPRGKSPRCPLDRRLGEPRAGLDAMREFPAPAGNLTPFVKPLASIYTD